MTATATDHVSSSSSTGSSIDNSVPAAPSLLTSTPEIPSFKEPNHPGVATIPTQICGKAQKRELKFQHNWFNIFPWLHWDTTKIVCYYCAMAYADSAPAGKGENAFISTGYKNWKHAIDNFKEHEGSTSHNDALRIFANRDKCVIATCLSAQINKGQMKARSVLKVVLSTWKYIGRQGIAVRGHLAETGNFVPS